MTTTTLGGCLAKINDTRCDGILMVDREVGAIIEATCDRCGYEAALPVVRLASDRLSEHEPKGIPF